jgi:hypothetical protein
VIFRPSAHVHSVQFPPLLRTHTDHHPSHHLSMAHENVRHDQPMANRMTSHFLVMAIQ